MADNTIHINSTLRVMQSMAHSQAAKTAAMSFGSILQQAAQKDELARYKDSVIEQILLMDIDPTRVRDDLFIDISDAGWEAMRADSSYEKWVLDTVRSALRSPDPFASVSGGSVTHFRFGATREEFRAGSGSKGSADIGSLTGTGKKKSYWEERAERIEKERELTAKISDAKARAHAANEMKRIRGEQTPGTDESAAAAEIMTLLIESYMQSM